MVVLYITYTRKSRKYKKNVDISNRKIYNYNNFRKKMVSSMKTILETGLIIRKEDIFSRMRRTLYAIFFPVEASIEYKIKEIEKPKNVITGKIIVPKEIGKYNKLGKEL